MSKDPSSQDAQTIGTLPRPWAIAVQLIGTFGLAVFLVVYYVLVMRPQEQARYDNLKASVDSLVDVVQKGYTLLTPDQARRVEELYAVAAGNEVGLYIHEQTQKGTPEEVLAVEIKQILLRRTELLRGLTTKGEKSLSATIASRLSDRRDLAQALAEKEWEGKSVEAVCGECRTLIEQEFAAWRTAK